MVAVVGEIAALLADELVVDDAEGNVGFHVVLALRRGLCLRHLVVSGLTPVVVLGTESRALDVAALPVVLGVVLVSFGLLGLLVWALGCLVTCKKIVEIGVAASQLGTLPEVVVD